MGDLIGGAIGLVVLAILGWFAKGRIEKSERERLEDEAQQDSARRIAEGREKMRAGRGDDPDERLRRNDGFWR